MLKFMQSMVALAAILFIFTGCNLGGSNSTASGGSVTPADLAALKAQLRVQVVQTAPFHLESDARYAGVSFNPTAVPAATTVAPAALGTSCGEDAPWPRTTQKCIIDAQGVSVTVPYPQGGAYAEMYPVFYNTPNCDDTNGGHAFVQFGPSTLTAVPTTGAIVFRVDPAVRGVMDATTYYHISAGTINTQLTVQSEAQSDGNCIATSFPGPVGMLPITQGVAGTWTAAPTGTLAAGTPQ